MKSKRINYLDLLRVIACLTVVLLHITTDKRDFFTSPTWYILNFMEGFTRWSVPVFVMISGVIFLNKRPSYSVILKKYLVRLLLVFIFWSGLYALFDFLHTGLFETAITNFLVGRVHLWYLYMAMGLYLITPLLYHICDNKKLSNLFIVLSFIFAFCIPQIRDVTRALGLTQASTIIGKISNMLTMNFVSGYVTYYLLGYKLNQMAIKPKYKLAVYCVGLVALILTSVFSNWFSFSSNIPDGIFFGNFTVNVLLSSISIFIGLKNIYPKLSVTIKTTLTKIAPCCLGVYLIHPLFIRLLDRFGSGQFAIQHPFIGVPILSVLVFSVSLTCVFLAQKFFSLSRDFLKSRHAGTSIG